MSSQKWLIQVYLMELRKMVAYRSDFWVNFIGQTAFSITLSYFLWLAIFESQDSEQIKGFSLDKIIFYYLIVPIVFRVQQGQGIGAISREIYDGSLNKFILYPINFMFYKITSYVAHSSFIFIQLIIITVIYYFGLNNDQSIIITLPNFLFFSLFLLLSAITYFFMNSLVEFVAFWADNIWSLGVIIRFITRFFGGGLIPLAFFPHWSQEALSYTPFPYMIHFPMKVFFGEFSVVEYLNSFTILTLWSVFFSILSNLIWNKGKYQYSGVGI